jgi:hypothetical protein
MVLSDATKNTENITACDFTESQLSDTVSALHKLMSRMEIQDIRRRRLAMLESELGGQSELINKTGLAQSYLSNLKHGRNKFGEKAARKIEKLSGKPYLWLDDVDIATVDASEIAKQIRLILDSVPEPLRDVVLQQIAKK